jgi:hypothetical protein
LAENDPRARIAALVALARCGDRTDGPAVFESLGGVRWDRLDEDGRLDLVRAYTLAFLRLGDPEKKARAAAVAHLDRHYPADSDRLNRELCPLLVYLDAPGVVGRTLDLLARAPTQEEQLVYVMTLRVAGSGWTADRRAAYFRWFDRAAAIRGGVSFEEYLREIKKAAPARLTPAERTALGDLLAEKPRKDPYAALKARPVIKEWKVDDLLAAADDIDRVEQGRLRIAAATHRTSLGGATDQNRSRQPHEANRVFQQPASVNPLARGSDVCDNLPQP